MERGVIIFFNNIVRFWKCDKIFPKGSLLYVYLNSVDFNNKFLEEVIRDRGVG